MKFHKTNFSDLIIIEPTIFNDERGCFFEAYNKVLFQSNGIQPEFVQDNISLSHKNVLRGLHFQNAPFAQGKIVSVIKGSVLDVVVDIRKASLTFGKHYSIELSDKNNLIFYVPAGFAHGFISLEDNTIFTYKCTNNYNKASEGGIIWNDSTLNIDWRTNAPLLSPKDLFLPPFIQLNSLF